MPSIALNKSIRDLVNSGPKGIDLTDFEEENTE